MENKIKELRKQKKITQTELAEHLHVTQPLVYYWETNRGQPDDEMIAKIAAFFDCSPEYLTGKSNIKNMPVKIKVYGEVAAGQPIEQVVDTDEDVEEISADMAKCGTYFGLRIKGDSMSPRIQNGDVVIVRQQPTIENGEIAIVSIAQDTATCKKIKKTDKGISLIGLNTSFEPLYYTWQEVAELPVTILGKVVELRAKL